MLRNRIGLLFLVPFCFSVLGCSHDDGAPSNGALEDPDAGAAGAAGQAGQGGQGGSAGESPDAAVLATAQGAAFLFGQSEHSGITLRVEGTEQSAVTDASGHFALSGLAQGSYTLQASRAPYMPAQLSFVVHQASVSLPELTLYRGALVQDGAQVVPLGMTPDRNSALYLKDYSPYTAVGTLALWDIQQKQSFELSQGVMAPSVMPSPDSSLILFYKNFVQSAGVGDLVVWDCHAHALTELGSGVIVNGVQFSSDGTTLAFLTDVDPTTTVGQLNLWRKNDPASRPIAPGVLAGSVQFHPSANQLVFADQVVPNSFVGTEHLWDIDAEQGKIIDTNLYLPSLIPNSDWSSFVYLKDVSPSWDVANVGAWQASTSTARTLGQRVTLDSLLIASDYSSLLFLSDYDADAQSGTLRVWRPSSGDLETVSTQVDRASLSRVENGSRVYFKSNVDLSTAIGQFSVWDFSLGSAIELGQEVQNWQQSPDGKAVAYVEHYQPSTSAGQLSVYDYQAAQKAIVGQDAANNVFIFSPEGKRLIYQAHPNPAPGTNDGQLWFYDLVSKQAEQLAARAWPVFEFSADGRLMTYHTDYDEPSLTSRLWVYSFAQHKKASLGIAPHLNIMTKFSPTADRLGFFRSYGISSGELWVWDSALHGWEGESLGSKVADSVSEMTCRYSGDGGRLFYVSNIDAGGEVGELNVWSFSAQAASRLGQGVQAATLQFSPDLQSFIYLANLSWPRGDVVWGDAASGTVRSLGQNANLQSLWLSSNWKRALLLVDSQGDMGTLRSWDLARLESVDWGQGVPYFGIRLSQSLDRVAFLADFEASSSVGDLFSANLLEDSVPTPIDARAPITFAVSEKDLLYVVQNSSPPSTHPNGLYWAPVGATQ